jgi:hypothetical protein
MVVAPVEAATVLVMVLVLARMLVPMLVLVLALVLTNTQVVTVWVGVEAAADAAVSAEVLAAAAAVAGASKPPSADAAARAVLGWRASAAHSIWAQLLPVMPMTGGLQAQTSLQVSNHSPSQLSCSSMERTMMYSLHLQL